MAIEPKRFDSTTELRRAAEPFLLRNEAHNSFLLGVISEIEEGANSSQRSPYMAAVFEDAEVVAVAAMVQGSSVALSLCHNPKALAQLASDLRNHQPDTPGVSSVVPTARQFASEWSHLAGENCVLRMSQDLYRLDRIQQPAGVSGVARRATERDIELLTNWFLAFAKEAMPWVESTFDVTINNVSARLKRAPNVGGVFVWQDDGQPVSVVAYGSPTPNSLHIGPVFTPPQYRRRGYAAACTAAVCEYILDTGKDFVTLFTDIANRTSSHIYQSIGFESVCGAEMISFAGR